MAIAETKPEKGMCRQVADGYGCTVGVEVWTGEEWLALASVAWISAMSGPYVPMVSPAHFTLHRVLPAAQPWPPRQPRAA